MKKIQNSIQNMINQLKISRFVPIILCFFIYIFCLALYINTTSYALSGNDDDTFINLSFENHSLKDIFTENVFFNTVIKTYYRPLLVISFMIDNSIAHSPAIMHSTNILLHALCAVLVFVFLKRYFFDNKLSFFTTLLFAAHPINVFSVAWIPGRNDSLLCLFFLLSLMFFMEYLRNNKKIFLLPYFLCFTAAIFIKENAGIIPVICLCFWFMHNKKINKEFFCIFLGQFIIVMSFFSIYSHFVELSNFSERVNAIISNYKMLFGYYSGAYLFDVHFSKYLSATNVILGIVSFCISILFAAFSGLKTKEKFFYFLLPMLMIVPVLMIGQIFFQGNRVYIPLIFMLIPFVSFLQRYFNDKVVWIILILLIIFSSVSTLKCQTVFKNEISYLGTIDKEKPNAEIYIANIYSYNLLKYSKLEEAEVKANEVAEITHYRNPYNLYVLSVINMHKGNFKQAIEYLEHIPNFDNDVYTKLTVCCSEVGDEQKANYYYNIVLQLNGNNIEQTNKIIEREKQCFVKK